MEMMRVPRDDSAPARHRACMGLARRVGWWPWIVSLGIGCVPAAETPQDGGPTTDARGLDAPATSDVDAAGIDAPVPPRDADLTGLSDQERMLVDMAPGTWLRVPSGYGSVCEATPSDEWHGIMGCEGVLAYSGAVWDPLHRQYLLWGGGHGDYAGNEVYAFRTHDFTWTRLTTPSAGPYDRGVLDDGRPDSRHTYDALTWIPSLASFWTVGGAGAFIGNATNEVWTFDPERAAFTRDTRGTDQAINYEASAVYDEATNRVVVIADGRFLLYDVATGAWEPIVDLGVPPYWPRYYGGRHRAVIDPTRRLLFAMGGGFYLVYELDSRRIVTDDWITTGGATFTNADVVAGHPEQVITTGGGEVITAGSPGLDYDAHADRLVAWTGHDLMALDLATRTWTHLPMEGAPVLHDPPRTQEERVYGRWRYLDRMNVFMLVVSTDEVWFYKHTAGG